MIMKSSGRLPQVPGPCRVGSRAVRPPAEQRTARIMGARFLGTFVFSIP